MDRVRAEYESRLTARKETASLFEKARAALWWIRAAILASLVPILGMASEGLHGGDIVWPNLLGEDREAHGR